MGHRKEFLVPAARVGAGFVFLKDFEHPMRSVRLLSLALAGAVLLCLTATGQARETGHPQADALRDAARLGNYGAVVRMVADGVPVDTPDPAGVTALMLAAAAGEHNVIRRLSVEGANLNGSDRDGVTPLMYVARNGHEKAARELVKRGADVNRSATDGRTALSLAVAEGWPGMVRILLDREADPNGSGTGPTPVEIAATSGFFDILKMLREAGAKGPIPKVVPTPTDELMTAARTGDTRAVKRVLRQAAVDSEDVGGHTALGWALRHDHKRTVRALLAAEADPEKALMDILRAAHTDRARALGALLAGGAQADLRSDTGVTPLMRAAAGGARDAANILVRRGAQVNAADAHGATPLLYAARAGAPTTVRMLISLGANVDRADRGGSSPLLTATELGFITTAHMLLDAGADPNRPGPGGLTPIMAAAAIGSVDLTQRLLEAGADPTMVDIHGKDAAQHAFSNHQAATWALLGGGGRTRDTASVDQVSFTGRSTTLPRLRDDTLTEIALHVAESGCKRLDAIRANILGAEPVPGQGVVRVKEEWNASYCGTRRAFVVTFTPDGYGATTIDVR